MGWWFQYKPSDMSVKEFFEKEFNGEKIKVLDCKVVNFKTAYLAIQNPLTIFGCVCLLEYKHNEHCNFGYKDMDESMEPYYYECPESILKLLSPLSDDPKDDGARRWREQCYKNIKKNKALGKIADGKTIQTNRGIGFMNGISADKFIVYDIKKNLYKTGGTLVRIPRKRLKDIGYELA